MQLVQCMVEMVIMILVFALVEGFFVIFHVVAVTDLKKRTVMYDGMLIL